MVEENLKKQAPRTDFAEKVFALLNLYPKGHCPHNWAVVIEELRRIGPPGIEGFIRAFAQPYALTRNWAIMMLEHIEPEDIEVVIALLKKGLKDSNKKVRRSAATTLLHLEVPRRHKQEEFIPLIAELLTDPSRNVRRILSTPWVLGEYSGDFPPRKLAAAIQRETDPQIRQRWQNLLTHTVAVRSNG